MYKVFKNGLQSYIINIISLSIIHVFVIFGIYRCDKNTYVQTLNQVFYPVEQTISYFRIYQKLKALYIFPHIVYNVAAALVSASGQTLFFVIAVLECFRNLLFL